MSDEITQSEFDRLLLDMVDTMNGSTILAIPGVYEIVAEELNNDVLEAWEDRGQ